MGSTGFVLTVAHVGGKRFTRGCPDGVLVIGRSTKAELQIVDATISSLHARLTVQGGRAWVEDLTSKNGTWVEGRRLPPGEIVELAPGTTVRLGEFFEMAYGEGSAPESDPPNPFAFSFEAGEGDQTADNPPGMFPGGRVQSGEIHAPTGGHPAAAPASPFGLADDGGYGGAPVRPRFGEPLPGFPEPPSVSLPWLSQGGPTASAAPPPAAMPSIAPPAVAPSVAMPVGPPAGQAPAKTMIAGSRPAEPGGPVPARRGPDAADGSVKGRIVFGRGSDVVEFSSSAQHPTRNPAKPGTATMVQLGPAAVSTRPGRAAADAGYGDTPAPGVGRQASPAGPEAHPAAQPFPAQQPSHPSVARGPQPFGQAQPAPSPSVPRPASFPQSPPQQPGYPGQFAGQPPATGPGGGAPWTPPQTPPGMMGQGRPPEGGPPAWGQQPFAPRPQPYAPVPSPGPAPSSAPPPSSPPRSSWAAPEPGQAFPSAGGFRAPAPAAAGPLPSFGAPSLGPGSPAPNRAEPSFGSFGGAPRGGPGFGGSPIHHAYSSQNAPAPLPVAPSEAPPPLAIPRHVRGGQDFALPNAPEEDEEDDAPASDRRRSPARRERPGREPAGARGRRKRRKKNAWLVPALLMGGLLVLGGVVWLFLKAVTHEDDRPVPHRRASSAESPARAPGRRP